MGNLIEIQTQIEKLQKQADEIKSREFDKTIKQIQAMMEAFGITLRDLSQVAGKPRQRRDKAMPVKKPSVKRAMRKASSKAGPKVAAKYRGPAGETWSGRGSMPRWLAELEAQGQTRESFAIKR